MKETNPKEAFNKFKPESCVFVISIDEEGKPSGMVAGWNTKCSLHPPMFAVSLSQNGYTHKLIRESGEFTICVPNKELEDAVNIFGSHHGDDVDKFDMSGVKTIASQHIKTPILADASICFECTLESELIVGDHILFVGKILASYTAEKGVLLNMKMIKNRRVFEEF